MPRNPGGKNNSFKHGTFTENFMIMPEENFDEFEQLHQGLIEEWKPIGTLEEDTVLTIAQHIWQKRRVDRYYYCEVTWAREHSEQEVLNTIDRYAGMLDANWNPKALTEFIDQLPERYRQCVKSIPRSEFNDEQSWIQSLKSIIQEMIELDEARIILQEERPRYKAEKATQLRELLAKKIALDERLDARIDKALKRLAQLKTFKQMLEDQASRTKTINHHNANRQAHLGRIGNDFHAGDFPLTKRRKQLCA